MLGEVLTPAFATGTFDYTLATVEESSECTWTSIYGDVVGDHDGASFVSGDTLVWTEGVNVVTITVTNGDLTQEYVVTVTHS